MPVLLFFLSVYCFLLILLYIGWKKTSGSVTTSQSENFISVIVPVRNEEENIAGLFGSLKSQTYNNFEILLVDDHSEDATVEQARKISLANLSIIKNSGSGKKQAITTGVSAAKGAIIATTDGDCIVSREWLQAINKTFQNPDVVFAFGGVSFPLSKSFFDNMQAIEFSSLIGTAAATANLHIPTMCNGANLCYRKNVFAEVRGYENNEHISSGDDEFLMRKIQSRYPTGIRFITERNAVVQSKPQPDIQSFFSQRVRWASKWRFNTSLFSKLLAVFIFLTHLSVIASFAFLVVSFVRSLAFLLIIKIVLEGFFLFGVSTFLRHRWNWPAFLVLQIIYPFYVIVVGAASAFIKISWKGRKIQ